MDHAERELFASGVRHALEAHTGADLDAALDRLGWRDALAFDPPAAVATVFGLQGETAAASAALDDVLAHGLGLGPDPDGVSPAPAPAEPAAVILPPLGRRTPPATRAGGAPAVRGLATGAVHRRPRALVVVEGRGGPVALVAEAGSLALRPSSGLDPRLGWVEVSGCAAGGAEVALAPGAWEAAVALGQLAVAHELVGAGRAMLALARDHAVDRVQFGRPIAGFQAVRHRLAEALVALEQADAALAAAADEPTPLAARIGKALAGHAARTVARHAQQVLAGIGFTTDHAFHRYLRRVLVLDQLLGSARDLTTELGTEVIAARRLPPLPAL